MSALARTAGFIVVYPNGTGRFADRLLTWNAGTCCGLAARRGVDEVAFVRALLDTLEATLPVDPNRIYATGMSNGGMMSYLVGCRLGDRIAAIAPVSGELTFADCKPARPVSLLVIHGTADENLPYAGGVGAKALDRHEVRSVDSALGIWRGVARCPAAPRVQRTGSVMHATYAPCAGGAVVELYQIGGGPHAWPGGQRMGRMLDEPSRALDATKVVWDFFAAHPRR
jgi:polyhydroxybutyrate depolymerase